MVVATLLLSLVLVAEVASFEKSGSLVIFVHFWEILADAAGYLTLLFVSVYSWWKDSNGREHGHHTEDDKAAEINLWIMLIGIIISSAKIAEGFFRPEPIESSWSLFGPICAFVIYVIIIFTVKNQDKSSGINALRGHVLGDVASSIIVVLSTILALNIETKWINPSAGLLIIVILATILVHQTDDYVVEKSLRL